jgi:diguanylate cyclase (GGDEF)-like protein
VLVSRSGQEYAIQDSAAPVRTRDGKVVGAVLVFNDVTETRRVAREISHQAAHDALTGLVNRREFEQRLEHALASAKAHGTAHALCYLDLDQFKIVNDSVGHAAGDELLKQVSGLLMGKLRARDTLARLGGDEFSLLIENCPQDKALDIAEALVAAVDDFRFVWEERRFEIGVSIGLVPITARAESPEQLLTQADKACYIAKDLGRKRVHVYQREDRDELSRRDTEILRITEVRDALEMKRFRLYQQPIVSLSTADKDPVIHELLLRLVDARDRIVLPSAFMPTADRYGLMSAIDRWVIQTAFQSSTRIIAGSPGAQISINLSGSSLSDDSLSAFVREQFALAAIPLNRVCFEITESSAIRDLSQATRFMKDMHSSGCRFALDDFGQGPSSFTYLKKLPLDYLKIGGSFVRDMVENPVDHAIVAAINQLGHVMGIQTIAECAETTPVIERLKHMGVDYAQGYGVSSPRPLEEYEPGAVRRG